MKFTRIQGEVNDSINTHETKWFKKIISQIGRITHYAHGRLDLDMNICDPFARDCTLGGDFTNDMNPETRAVFHRDAIDFLKECPTDFFNLVIFDPPFSEVQADRKYGEAVNIYTIPGYVPACMKEIQRILKPGGYFLKFGYNTNSSHTDFELKYIWDVHFAGNKNDVLVSYWQMNQRSLKEWENEINV